METDQLAELIAKKYEVLEELRELSRRQDGLIQDTDLPRLMSLLSAKQHLLNQLQQLERRLDPFRQQDPDQRIWRSQADRQRCRTMAERCESMLSEIMLIERQSECELLRRRDLAAAQLQGVHTAAHASGEYAKTSNTQRGHLDLTSEE